MSPGPKPVTITVTAQDRDDLEAVTRQATGHQRDVFRARIILLAADGYNNTEIAAELGCRRKTVRKWRTRFADAGRAGLTDEPRLGRPPIYDDSVRALITAIACELPAKRRLPLSRLSILDIHMVAGCEIDPCPSPSTIAAWLKQAAIKPWTYTSWKTPRDPEFKQKASPVLDLYNGTWNGAELTDRDVVVCADEKTAICARSRHQRSPGPGRPFRVDHEYERHGGCTYQAALIVGTGEVYGQCVVKNTRANFERLVEMVMAEPICQELSSLHTQRLYLPSDAVVTQQAMDLVRVLGPVLNQFLAAHKCAGLSNFVGWGVAFWNRAQPNHPSKLFRVNAVRFLV